MNIDTTVLRVGTLTDCAHKMVPLLTAVLNLSLRSGVVPARLKKARVRPLLKKPGLDKSVLNNYRPVSSLPYLPKIIERVVAARLSTHMSEHNLSEPCQRAYKPSHSAETALLCAQNDILKEMDNQKVTILMQLHLSAAFDTVDHKVLLRRLSQDVGVAHHALKFSTSYMNDRTQSVQTHDATSPVRPLPYGVPQGSVLGTVIDDPQSRRPTFKSNRMSLGGIRGLTQEMTSDTSLRK